MKGYAGKKYTLASLQKKNLKEGTLENNLHFSYPSMDSKVMTPITNPLTIESLVTTVPINVYGKKIIHHIIYKVQNMYLDKGAYKNTWPKIIMDIMTTITAALEPFASNTKIEQGRPSIYPIMMEMYATFAHQGDTENKIELVPGISEVKLKRLISSSEPELNQSLVDYVRIFNNELPFEGFWNVEFDILITENFMPQGGKIVPL